VAAAVAVLVIQPAQAELVEAAYALFVIQTRFQLWLQQLDHQL
jgi:hypothetical protein